MSANNIYRGVIKDDQLPKNNNESQPSTPSGVDAPTSTVEISAGTSLDAVGETGLDEAKQYPSEGLQFTEGIINNLPPPLRAIVEVFITAKERSLMLSTLLAAAASAMPNVQGTYGGKGISPNLYVMNLGLYGTGKSLQGFACNLLAGIIELLNTEQKEAENQYQIDLATYEEAKKAGEDCDKPVPPPIKRLIVAGNITKTLLITRIADNPHGIIIIEVEGDTIVTANKMDSNNYMDVMRAAYANETISVERKGGELSLRVNRPVACLLASMTYNQLYKLIPDIEDGMYSRIAFTNLPVTDVFEDMFDEGRENYENSMNEKGKILLHVFNLLRGRSIDRPVMVKLGNIQQRIKFQETFQKYKSEYMENLSLEHGGLVNRLGLLAFKVLMVLSIYRNYDGNIGDIDGTILATDDDFANTLRIVEVFRRNSLYVQGMMPKPKNTGSSDKAEQLENKAEKMRRAQELLNKGMRYSKIALEILGSIKQKGTIYRWLNTK